MIYDIEQTELVDLLQDSRLVASIMASKPMITEFEAKEKITRAYEITLSYSKPIPVNTSDHKPCDDCGGIDFQRTGTCHVCRTCGKSQGCS